MEGWEGQVLASISLSSQEGGGGVERESDTEKEWNKERGFGEDDWLLKSLYLTIKRHWEGIYMCYYQ